MDKNVKIWKDCPRASPRKSYRHDRKPEFDGKLARFCRKNGIIHD